MNFRIFQIGMAALTLFTAIPASAQTLEETALFIMTGNANPQLEDMGDRFKVKNAREPDTFVLKMTPDTCVFQMETVSNRPNPDTNKLRPVKSVQRVDFNKIDPSNISDSMRQIGNGLMRSVQMKGSDDETACRWLETPEQGKIPIMCLPMVSIFPSDMAGNYERLPKAIKHLYGTYCKGTKKAF